MIDEAALAAAVQVDGTARIARLSADHAAAAAALHLHYLRSALRSPAGRRLLAAYYACIADAEGACGFVALRGGEVRGFVCGVWDGGRVRSRLLRLHWRRLLPWAAAHFLTRPWQLWDQLRDLRFRRSEGGPTSPVYELRPIVVHSAERGSGLAARLFEALLRDAAGRGFAQMRLSVRRDNSAAIRFYEKHGFHRAGNATTDADPYLQFEYDLLSPGGYRR